MTFLYGPQLIDVPVLADQQDLIYISSVGCSLEDLPGAMDKKDEWIGLIWFNSISTIVGYLMPMPFS